MSLQPPFGSGMVRRVPCVMMCRCGSWMPSPVSGLGLADNGDRSSWPVRRAMAHLDG